ncbi:hypothetical protein GWI33_000294 [Rhynchophorus ferrugineus]|uniref:Uncharacterized protein n=1 Tax=Rhynchophorus ferrugineus TaxID=354439 RepID=A0A834M418_RHYFE|nr:hypothetical protein GWI33_000294 [Rhynchophorus ferrugineus]
MENPTVHRACRRSTPGRGAPSKDPADHIESSRDFCGVARLEPIGGIAFNLRHSYRGIRWKNDRSMGGMVRERVLCFINTLGVKYLIALLNSLDLLILSTIYLVSKYTS